MAAIVALILGTSVPGSWAGNRHEDDDDDHEVPFAIASIFFEYNSTDKDLGIHISFDAPGWEVVKVTFPKRTGPRTSSGSDGRRDGRNGDARTLFEVKNGGSLKQVGSTEVFTESAEPALCPEDNEDCNGEELQEAIDAFLAKFPEGTYEFEGRTTDRRELDGEAELSWELPDAVEILDAEANFPTIAWNPGAGNDVALYQVIAEMVVAGANGAEVTYAQTTDVPKGITSVETSDAFAESAEQFETDGTLLELKVEVIAVGRNGNKTTAEAVVFEVP
jgi:hypothetical protein